MKILFLLFLFQIKASGDNSTEKLLHLQKRFFLVSQEISMLNRLLALNRGVFIDLPGMCQGRLTTESGVPLSTSDRTSQGTLYFTPYQGSTVSLYDGTDWIAYTLSEVSLALSLTSGKNYDVFLYNNAGTRTLELSAAWTNDTTRADALTTQNGIYVKSGATSRRYLGTIRASGANVTEDSAAKRFVWNYCNGLKRPLSKTDTTDSWNYTTGSFRSANNSANNRIQFVNGMPTTLVTARTAAIAWSLTDSIPISSGIGLDSTTVNSAPLRGSECMVGSDDQTLSEYYGYPGIGFHYLQWLEYGNTGVSFYGDEGQSAGYQSGIMGEIEG